MEQIKISALNLHPVLVHLEDEIEDKNLTNALSINPTYVESNQTLDVSLSSILISGAATLVTTLLIEYFKKSLDKNLQNEITLTKKNEIGDEVKLTIKGLSIQDAELQMRAFMNI